MGLLRPATPGFLTTLVATILLAVVSFSVPLFKSVYFLKASLKVENVDGSITFGTLGYCIQSGSSNICSNATVGYELDINKLVGNKLPIQIPSVAVKWLTYALVLHIVALGLAGISAIFGLLAHVREMSMTCFSSCISGFAAGIALLAFIFDVAFFFIAKSRLNKVKGGSATIGNAIWLTLAAWILLFFSGCFYTLGRCCIKKRPRGSGKWDNRDNNAPFTNNGYAEQMRLDAVKAEADRKARQKQGEGGLPAFHEYDPSEPLKARVVDDEVYVDEVAHAPPYRDQHNVTATTTGAYAQSTPGGYVQAPPGTRAVDEYYTPSNNQQSTYPPQAPTPVNNQYLMTSPQDPYGHTQGGTSYHSAQTHQQYPTNYSQYDQSHGAGGFDPYNQPPTRQPSGYSNDQHYYSQSPPIPQPPINYASQTPPVSQSPVIYASQSPPLPQHDRQYTLGGDGYGSNVLPPLHDNAPSHNAAYAYAGVDHSPAPIDTNVAVMPSTTSPIRGPRSPRTQPMYDDPPGYDQGPSEHVPGGWGKS